MKKTLLASLVCVVALAGCNQKEEAVAPTQSQPEANPICSADNLAGGWSKGEVTPEAQQALDFVLGQMNTAAKLKEILSVRTQVVNGLNYAIEFEMDNGEVWNTIVYRSLKGDMEMTQPAQQGRICP
ncbi:MAG: cystatin domain-containing protein [Pseudomonadota bacterium]|uniref:cystatin domain-containing protein n=1 Tax=Vibrio TaxID=662 RepID=UPI000D3F7EAF|nr:MULTISPECIES: cystatin domain-containing protein [Vibrio]MCC4226047.1 cystatin domain-containing protein [Vibrio campbellii]MDK9758009.1 2-oxoglutarate dehydrogenase [Vibrio sp. D173a]PQJ37971.1 2-oxoglutarate dehydrogenase [Vibrio campbellii]